MKKLSKYVASLILLVVAGLFFVANFSAAESRFECSGVFTQSGQQTPSKIFLKVEEYRWWVGLWGKSDGTAWFEIPNSGVGFYPHIKEVGDQLQIYEGPSSIIKGNFSKLSLALTLFATSSGMFEGICKESPKR